MSAPKSNSPEQPEDQRSPERVDESTTANTSEQESSGDRTEASPPPVRPGPTGEVATRSGRRVTRRTVDRSEVTEHTVETVTEDIPIEAYQGPASAHPAPVG